MKHVRDGYRGLSVFMGVNIDRVATTLVIAVTMLLALWVQSQLI